MVKLIYQCSYMDNLYITYVLRSIILTNSLIQLEACTYVATYIEASYTYVASY